VQRVTRGESSSAIPSSAYTTFDHRAARKFEKNWAALTVMYPSLWFESYEGPL
jgi:hypothetical protein